MRASASSVSQALSNINNSNSNNNNNSNNSSSSSSSSSNSNRVLNLQFPPAEQPDIVRAAQKDDFYKRLFSDQCYDLVGRMVGARYSLQHQGVVRLLAASVYYALNTLSGPDQTLGEEYCDILMVQPRGGVQVPPGVLTRVVQVGWHVVVPYLAGRVAERGTGYLQALAAGSSVAASLVPKLLPAIRGLAPKLQRLHLALFYFDGKFYDFSKRLSNIHYVFNGKVDQRRPKYHILGALILIQFAVSLLIYMREKLGILRKLNLQIEDLSEASQEPEEDKGQATNANKCTLCLEPRTNTTATLCGHLFCWNCITEWCNNKAECPLCRRPLTLQSLVCVYHYQ